MCGIVGALARSANSTHGITDAIVRRMAVQIRHRGPDGIGVWTDAAAGIGLGHTRLAIIDPSARGAQPMISPTGRYVITFNGEIYNYPALRNEVADFGEFRSTSDTEVLLRCAEKWGVEKSLHRLNGMFAFALWDRKERTLYLARDRFGEKPLYYGWANGVLLFGSELRALRAHPSFCFDIDPGVLPAYLRRGYIPSPYSIYKGVHKLPPASFLKIAADTGDSGRIDRYWSPVEAAHDGARKRLEKAAVSEELTERFREAVRTRMVSDVPIGALLSGGIDSSLVAAVMQEHSSAPIKTFTIGFQDTALDEAPVARTIAAHLGTEHTQAYVSSQQLLDTVPLLSSLYDEPFADSSQIPTFLVSQLARKSVKVALSGDGGDELFAGYSLYRIADKIERRFGWIPRTIRDGITKIIDRAPLLGSLTYSSGAGFPIRRDREAARRLRRMICAADDPALYFEMLRGPVDYSSLLLFREERPSLLSDPSGWPPAPSLVETMMLVDTMAYLPDDILVKVDRASMSVGLECRAPFLDHRLYEFAARVPLESKLSNGAGKLVLREHLKNYLPHSIAALPKRGFAVPLGSWLRGPLRPWAEALLSPDRLQTEGFFSANAVQLLWRQHLTGVRNKAACLWAVLVFQQWLESIQVRATQDEMPGYSSARHSNPSI